MKKILSMFIGLFLISCGSQKQPTVVTKTITVTEVVKDTVFKIKSDTIRVAYRVECPDGNPPTLKPQTPQTPSKGNLNGTLNTPDVRLQGNELTIDCTTKAQELFAQWKEKHVQERIEVPVMVEKELSWWQKLYLSIGMFAFWAGIGFIAFKLIKKRFI